MGWEKESMNWRPGEYLEQAKNKIVPCQQLLYHENAVCWGERGFQESVVRHCGISSALAVALKPTVQGISGSWEVTSLLLLFVCSLFL